MFKVILCVPALSLIVSCNKEEQVPIVTDFPKPAIIESKYLFTNEEHYNSREAAGTAYFTYNSIGNILKREGGYIDVVNFPFYLREVYDTIIISGSNSVSIEAGVNVSGITVLPSKRKLSFNNGVLSQKITFGNSPGDLDNDTTYYFYDASGRLQRTEQYNTTMYYVKSLTFDTKGNLQQVTGVRRNRSNNNIFITTQETFSGYDNSPNQLKIFNFWDDTFLRSLSNNNFSGYSYIKKDSVDNIIAQQQKLWVFIYDGSGIPDFSR